MKTSKYFILFLVLFIFSMVEAANIGDNDLNVGKKGSSANKTIKLGTTRKIRSNESAGRLEFSNDGTNYKSFGSGSGGSGGTNVLADSNSDFEAGITGWTVSAGSFLAESTTPLSGTFSGKLNSSATAQTLSSAAILITAGFEGRKCQLHIPYYKYATGTTGDYNVKVLDGDGNLVVSAINFELTGATATRGIFQTFDCPALNGANNTDQLKVVITSTADAGDLIFDDVFLGQGRNNISSSQANIFGILNYAGTTNCSWTTTSASVATFAVDADCPSPTVTQNALAPVTKIPAVRFASLPAGNYKVTALGQFVSGSSSTGIPECIYELYDGTNSKAKVILTEQVSTGNETVNSLVGVFSYGTAQTNAQFEVRAARQLGNGACLVHNAHTAGELSFIVEQIPTASFEGSTYETSGWNVQATITGNFNLGSGTVAAPIAPSDAGGVLSNTGTTAAMIPCSTTNPATGTTCAVGTETPGITFTVPRAGAYNICVSGTHAVSDSSGATAADATDIFSIVETGNADQTILNTLGTSVSSRLTTVDVSQITSIQHPVNLCRTGFFATAGLKTLRLMYTQSASGTLSANSIGGLNFQVFPITEQMPSPVFNEYATALSLKPESSANEKILRAQINCASTSTIVSQSGNWIASVGNVDGNGSCSIGLVGTPFSAAPTCTMSAETGAAVGLITNIGPTTTTALATRCRTAANAACTGGVTFDVLCMGPK